MNLASVVVGDRELDHSDRRPRKIGWRHAGGIYSVNVMMLWMGSRTIISSTNG